MPNLTAHIDIALECAASLSHPAIAHNLGAFVLGSCSPDIRIVTRGPRDNTHFAPISNDTLGAGMALMFGAYPSLANGRSLSPQTGAFMAGYIAHLLADEAWIIKVYRPYFGNRALFADEMFANVVDRAMQLDMDRAAAERRLGFQEVTPLLAGAPQGVQVEFLSDGLLAEFCLRVSEATQRPFAWERLLAMARRQYPQQNGTAQEMAQRFLEEMPGSLERAYQRLPPGAIPGFRETIVQEWTRRMRAYLP
ncbi:MAG: zinc dependent phospholipase C family protein [Chloroflexi bacterium]|nr:zinc dependent phospholipase C family protein [Chloroflexota bacterium]